LLHANPGGRRKEKEKAAITQRGKNGPILSSNEEKGAMRKDTLLPIRTSTDRESTIFGKFRK